MQIEEENIRSDLETEPKQCNAAKGEIAADHQLMGPGGSGTTVDTSSGAVNEAVSAKVRYSQLSPKKVL